MHLILLPGMDGTGDLFDPILPFFSGKLTAQVVRYPNDRVVNLAACTACLARVAGNRAIRVVGRIVFGPDCNFRRSVKPSKSRRHHSLRVVCTCTDAKVGAARGDGPSITIDACAAAVRLAIVVGSLCRDHRGPINDIGHAKTNPRSTFRATSGRFNSRCHVAIGRNTRSDALSESITRSIRTSRCERIGLRDQSGCRSPQNRWSTFLVAGFAAGIGGENIVVLFWVDSLKHVSRNCRLRK